MFACIKRAISRGPRIFTASIQGIILFVRGVRSLFSAYVNEISKGGGGRVHDPPPPIPIYMYIHIRTLKLPFARIWFCNVYHRGEGVASDCLLSTFII